MVTTTVFNNGGSQAVRIPKDFRFPGTRVSIERRNGGIFLKPLPEKVSCDAFFAACDDVKDDLVGFLSKRPGNKIEKGRNPF